MVKRRMVDAELGKIVTLCLSMDEQAVDVYRGFAADAPNRNLAAFWTRMAAEEKSHVKNWNGVLKAVRTGKFPPIFDDARKILPELEARCRKIQALAGRIEGGASLQEQFCLAYRLADEMLLAAKTAGRNRVMISAQHHQCLLVPDTDPVNPQSPRS